MRLFMLRHLVIAEIILILSLDLSAQCEFKTIAGPPPNVTGDGGPATSAWMSGPTGIAVDASGNVYIADTQNHRIRMVDKNGNMHTFAGNGVQGSGGDGGQATSASLSLPQAVMAAPDGSIYIADTGNNKIRGVIADGTIILVAGTGHPGFSGDGGSALAAELNGPQGMAFDAQGNLYLADTGNNRIRKVDGSGTITTIAGTDHSDTFPTFGGDGGPATQAYLYLPQGIAFARDGSLLIADTSNAALRKVAKDGTISTLTGGPGRQSSDTYPQPASTAFLQSVNSIVVQADGSIVIATVLQLLLLTPDGSTVQLYSNYYLGHNLAQDTAGGVYVTGGTRDDVIWRLDQANASPALFAGQLHYGAGVEGGSAIGATLNSPLGMAVGPDGALYVADRGNHRVAKILSDGTIHTFAKINDPTKLAIDSKGNLFVIDHGYFVRKITPDGTISLYAGSLVGSAPFTFEPPNTAATSVVLEYLYSIAVDSSDNLDLVFQSPINRVGYILRVTPDGNLQTISSGPATSPTPYITDQTEITLDAHENIFFNVTVSNFLMGLTPSLQLLAGLIQPPPSIDLSAGPSGNFFVIDESNRIKQLVDGQYLSIFNGDLSAYLSALSVAPSPFEFNAMSIFADAKGNLYVSDQFLERIRVLPAGSCSVAPGPAITSIVDSGSYNVSTSQEAYAPGELITIEGTGLGPTTGIGPILDANGLIPKNLSGVTVLFNGIPGPVFYASSTQINAIIPFTLYGVTSAKVQVVYNGQTSDAIPISMAPAAPKIFSTIQTIGQNVFEATNIVVNQNGTLNSISNPAHLGEYVTFYSTGMGRTNPEGLDGHPATLPLASPALPVTVDYGTLLYAGNAYGFVEGAMQINLRLPATPNGRSGFIQVKITVGSATTAAFFYVQ